MELLNQKLAVYAGSFDPITRGHLDIIRRAATVCDRLVVAIGLNPAKKTWFSVPKRIDLIRDATRELQNVSVDAYDGLLVDYCKKIHANLILRGLRSTTDFDFEMQLATLNRDLAPEIQTLFMPASPEFTAVSSSAVKEIAMFRHPVDHYVTPLVAAEIQNYLTHQA